jgi:rubrerythrin
MPTYDPTEHEDEREERMRAAAAQGALKAMHERTARRFDALLIAGGGAIYVQGVKQPFEYFCWACGQLRLNLTDEAFEGCGACGNDGKGELEIIAAAPGHLDRDVLKRAWAEEQPPR